MNVCFLVVVFHFLTEMGEESEEYDVTLSRPEGQVLLYDSDVTVTVELYICEAQLSCDKFDTFSL